MCSASKGIFRKGCFLFLHCSVEDQSCYYFRMEVKEMAEMEMVAAEKDGLR